MKARVLMAGPVPRRFAGVSKVAGMILDSSLPGLLDMRYVASGTQGSLYQKAWRGLAGLAQVTWLLIRWHPDLVHLHVTKGMSLVRKSMVMHVARRCKVPVVLHFHSFLSETIDPDGQARQPDVYRDSPHCLRRLLLNMLDHADRILVLSDLYRSSFGTITSNKHLVVLPNPVDCGQYRANPAAARDRIVLFMGSLSQRKGAQDLVRAAPAVQAMVPDVRFVLCGDDEDGALARLVRQAGIEAAVQLPGFVSGAEKRDWLERAAVFALPSYQEGVPIAILEAMAAGLPIVTTPVGGIPDVLQAGTQALFLEPGDTQSLAEHLISLLRNEAQRQEMGARNRREAEATYDLPRFVDRMMAIYAEVLADITPGLPHRHD